MSLFFSEGDEAQDHAYGDLELDARIQRLIEAREAPQGQGGGVSGVMPPPAQSIPRGRVPFIDMPADLPAFGQGARGSHRRGEDQGYDAGRQPDESGAQERSGMSQWKVKQEDEGLSPLDEYFCKGMDTSGPAAWATVLQDMTEGSLPDVGQLNAREGVREEKWVALDLRTTKFPPTQTSSVRRANHQSFSSFIRTGSDSWSPTGLTGLPEEGRSNDSQRLDKEVAGRAVAWSCRSCCEPSTSAYLDLAGMLGLGQDVEA